MSSLQKSCVASVLSLTLLIGVAPAALAQEVTSEPPVRQQSPQEPCPKGKRGGAIGGIVMGSIFWWLLPMSIPVLITQTKKLKAHNKARHERRCQYATGP
jgi:hypothetical protein